MIRKVLKNTSQRLRQKSEPLKIEEIPSLNNTIEDLLDTLKFEGGVGLAAPQINVRKQIIAAVVRLSTSELPVPVIMINPVIIEKSDKLIDSKEACLSIPGIEGIVKRNQEITIEYLELDSNLRKAILFDEEACIVHHEMDHLSGVLFIDKMEK